MEPLSAVLVPVPAAEPVVGAVRAELDRHAAIGVPAHVTVMAPFLPVTELDAAAVAALAAAVVTVPAFGVAFAEVRWFDDRLIWLAPEPAAPFVALTRAVGDRFGLVPYAGEYGPDPVPHLTVGFDGPVERLRAAAALVSSRLPVVTRIDRVVLMIDDDDGWRPRVELPLG